MIGFDHNRKDNVHICLHCSTTKETTVFSDKISFMVLGAMLNMSDMLDSDIVMSYVQTNLCI